MLSCLRSTGRSERVPQPCDTASPARWFKESRLHCIFDAQATNVIRDQRVGNVGDGQDSSEGVSK